VNLFNLHTKLNKVFTNRLLVVIASLLVAAAPSQSQGYLKVNGKQIVNGNGEEIILRSMGLGGWMLQEPYMLQLAGFAYAQHDIKKKITDLVGTERTKSFYDAWLLNHCTKTDIDSMASWGFNSVRLPMHYNLYTLPVEEEPVAGKNTWLEKGFAFTDSLLNWCKANKIYLILDLHAAPGAQGNDAPIADKDTTKPLLWTSEANQQKTIALWRKLAERYANEPWIGGYDLLNETNYGFLNPADKNGCADTVNAPLKKLLSEITATIREVDKQHIIFVEGNCWANNYKGLLPFADRNTVVSFHKYWNYNDQNAIQGFIDIRNQYNVPIWLGESGENSNAWYTDAIQLLERNKIGWAWWPLKKLGFNNPLQVQTNDGYKAIINYWKGTGAKPSSEEAYKSLMQLADAVKIQNTKYKKDVVDAMFRQVNSNATLPFKSNTIKGTTTIYASDYDLGRSGYAYHDKDSANYRVSTGKNTPWNSGYSYRNDGVDIEPCKDTQSNGFNVFNTMPGEWLQYTVNVSKASDYRLNFRVASKDAVGSFQVILNNTAVGTVSVPATGDTQNWATVTLPKLTLRKGNNVIRIKIINGGFGLHYMQLQPANDKR
jgi:endoglucanase